MSFPENLYQLDWRSGVYVKYEDPFPNKNLCFGECGKILVGHKSFCEDCDKVMSEKILIETK